MSSSLRHGIVLVAAGAMMACAHQSAGSESEDALRGAALELEAGGEGRFTLEAEAWRSFQPIRKTPAGDPLIVVVRLTGSAPIAPGVSVEVVHLVRGRTVWSAQPREEQPRASGASSLEVVAREGPDWAPGDSIDVVARVRLASGAGRLLRAPRVVIARVD